MEQFSSFDQQNHPEIQVKPTFPPSPTVSKNCSEESYNKNSSIEYGNDKPEKLKVFPKEKAVNNGNDEVFNTSPAITDSKVSGGVREEVPEKAYKLRPRKKVNGNTMEAEEGKTEKMTRFSLALTKEEIEEDFIKMTGRLPPKRLKRRGKNVEKKMNSVFPGMYLDELPDFYKVTDDAQNL